MNDSDSYYEKPFLILSNTLSKNKIEHETINDNLGQDDISLDKYLSLNNLEYKDKISEHQENGLKIKNNFNFFANSNFRDYILERKKSNNKTWINNSSNIFAAQRAIIEHATPDDFNMNFIKPKLEDDIFLENMNQVQPLKNKGRDIHPKNNIKKRLNSSSPKKIEFIILNQQEYVQAHIVGFNALKFTQLQNGFFSIEARLDLHGLSSTQAYGVLLNFIKLAWHKNLGCILIVCGRGHNSSTGFAVLKYKLQEWLTQEPFKRVVLAFCSAKPYDGGVGSFYVLLRKYNSKNKISWNNAFLDLDSF